MLLPRSAGGGETEPALYVAAIEELARHDASVAWNVFVANSSCLIAAYLEPAANHAIFADPRSIVAWGPPNASRASAVDAGYCLTGKWDFASGCRRPLDGRALPCPRSGRHVAAQSLRPAHGPHAAVSGRRGDPARHLADDWAARTASDSYCVDDVFVSEAFSTTREDRRCATSAARSMPYHAVPLRDRGRRRGFGIARAMLSEFIALASRKAPRNLARLADSAVVQADVARAEARLGSARAYLIETLSTIYAHADDVAPIEVADRAVCGSPAPTRSRAQPRWQTSPTRERASTRSSRQPVRAPLPRHAHALAADPGTRRSFRTGRADPARRPARGISLNEP